MKARGKMFGVLCSEEFPHPSTRIHKHTNTERQAQADRHTHTQAYRQTGRSVGNSILSLCGEEESKQLQPVPVRRTQRQARPHRSHSIVSGARVCIHERLEVKIVGGFVIVVNATDVCRGRQCKRGGEGRG